MKIKIVFIIPSLRGGGAERVIRHLVKNIDSKKFSIKLITINLHKSQFQDDVEGIEIINLDIKRIRFSILAILKRIWELKPDIIFSTMGYLNIYLACFKAFFPKKTRLIARETNIVSKRIKLNRYPWIWKQLYILLKNNFYKVICQSEDMMKDLKDNFGYKKNLVLINNPVDKNFILNKIKGIEYKESKTVRFLAIGRLSYQKGFDILINAASHLNIDDFEINIIGDGELKEDLQKLIIEKKLSKKVFLRGFQKNPYKWIMASDALILSSRFEGFSNVVLESLALQTPVIAVPAPGGVKEVLNNIDGCMISSSISAESLSETMVKWNNSKPKLSDNVVDKYSVQNIVQKYEKVFKEY